MSYIKKDPPNKPTINPEKFQEYLEDSFQRARNLFELDPRAELKARMLVATCDDVTGDDWKTSLVLFAEFDENRYAAVRAAGTRFGEERQGVVAVYLISEVWFSTQRWDAWKAHPENQVAPIDDPDRKEAVMVVGMTLDLQVVVKEAMIERDEQGRARIVPWPFEGQPMHLESKLVKQFFIGYARAYKAARARLN